MRADIKKRREKKKGESMAQKIFKGKDLLTSRPSGMNFEQYKLMQYYQNRTLKELFRHKPDRRIAALMRPSTPSLHLQTMVLRRRIENEEKEMMKTAEVHKPTFMTSVFNFLRNGFTRQIS